MKKLLAIILFVTLVVGFTGVASAANWEYIGSDDKQGCFFDTESFKKTGSQTYAVWVKAEYTDAYGRELAKKYRFDRPVSHMLTKYEYNYVDSKARILQVIFYDKGRKTITSGDFSDTATWGSLIPDSMGEMIFHTTYDYYKKHYQ